MIIFLYVNRLHQSATFNIAYKTAFVFDMTYGNQTELLGAEEQVRF